MSMNEKATLFQEEIENLLYEKYGMRTCKIERVAKGRSNIYKVFDSSEIYILKIYQDSISIASVYRETQICNYLNSNGFITSKYRKCCDGEYVGTYRGAIFTLQYFIEGRTYSNHHAPQWMISASAELLGVIHTKLKTYPLPKRHFGSEWPNSENINYAKKEHKLIIEKAESVIDRYSSVIINDMNRKLKLIDSISEGKTINCDKLSWASTHGDYCLMQMIIENQNRIALIDFSSCGRMPVIWEIIRSYSFIDKTCQFGIIDLSVLRSYIKNYEKTSCVKLSDYDRLEIFRLYGLQLLLSVGGYREYYELNNKTLKEDFIQFAFWRTKLMEYIMENIDLLHIG